MLNPFNCPSPLAVSFCSMYIRFFFGFFTVGYSKLISELFTKSHFSPSASTSSQFITCLPWPAPSHLLPAAAACQLVSFPHPFPESSSTQILCILDEFSSQFCFHHNFRCLKRAKREKKNLLLFFTIIFMQLDEKFQHQH